MEIYMDNAATTRVYPEVVQLMNKIMEEDYGNPSSLHMKGVEAERYIRHAREILAGILKVEEKELIFTSGGTWTMSDPTGRVWSSRPGTGHWRCAAARSWRPTTP